MQDFVDGLRGQGLSPSTITNILDPLRVIYRRGLRRDEVAVDPTDHLELPAVIRVERYWDPVKGPIDVKSGAGRRAVPMAFVVRRELMAHKQRSGRAAADLVFGRTATEPFYASTVQARANRAWSAAGLEPITPHEARHCAISYFIAAGLDWKQISTWAGHGDVRQTWNRYGHLVPGGEQEAAERLNAYLSPPTVAHPLRNAESPVVTGDPKYRYRDSKPASEE